MDHTKDVALQILQCGEALGKWQYNVITLIKYSSIPIMRMDWYRRSAHEGTSRAIQGDESTIKEWSHHIKEE